VGGVCVLRGILKEGTGSWERKKGGWSGYKGQTKGAKLKGAKLTKGWGHVGEKSKGGMSLLGGNVTAGKCQRGSGIPAKDTEDALS